MLRKQYRIGDVVYRIERRPRCDFIVEQIITCIAWTTDPGTWIVVSSNEELDVRLLTDRPHDSSILYCTNLSSGITSYPIDLYSSIDDLLKVNIWEGESTIRVYQRSGDPRKRFILERIRTFSRLCEYSRLLLSRTGFSFKNQQEMMILFHEECTLWLTTKIFILRNKRKLIIEEVPPIQEIRNGNKSTYTPGYAPHHKVSD